MGLDVVVEDSNVQEYPIKIEIKDHASSWVTYTRDLNYKQLSDYCQNWENYGLKRPINILA
jgi:hypothetical protein